MYPRQVVQNNHEIRRALPGLGQKLLGKTEAHRVTVAAKDVRQLLAGLVGRPGDKNRNLCGHPGPLQAGFIAH